MDDDSFNFNDGWGDDDDLELDEIDNEVSNDNGYSNNNNAAMAVQVQKVATTAKAKAKAKATPVMAQKLSVSPNSFDLNDGWDDDDANDLDLDFHDDDDNDDDDGTSDNANSSANVSANVHAVLKPKAMHPVNHHHNERQQHQQQINPHSHSHSHSHPSTTTSKLEQQLIQYITTLSPSTSPSSSSIISTINTKFKRTKNTNPEAALELCRYYHTRPQLTEYTIDVEIPRMEYQIMVSDELILVDAMEIQQYFQQNPIDNLVDDMLLRASNQSLLADIFPMITSTGSTGSTGSGSSLDCHDIDNNIDIESCGIIRSELLATAVATKCRFVLDMREERSTQVECTLVVSVPYIQQETSIDNGSNSGNSNSNINNSSTSNDSKLDVASVRIMVQFSPEPSAPYVKYHLVSIDPMLNVNSPTDREKIRIAARVLEEIIGIDQDQHHYHHHHHHQRSPEKFTYNQHTDTFRDNFLQSLATTQSGFRSALRDIDGVVNVSSKLDYLKKVSAKVQQEVAVAVALPVLQVKVPSSSAEDIIKASASASEIGQEDRYIDNAGVHAGVHAGHGVERGVLSLGPGPRLPPRPSSSSSSLLGGSVPVHQEQDTGRPVQLPPPPPPMTSQQKRSTSISASTSSSHRPIIGGLLLSGISHLAEKVAAPSDGIPTLYRKDDGMNESNINNDQQYQHQQHQHQQHQHPNHHNFQSTMELKQDSTGKNDGEKQMNMIKSDTNIIQDEGKDDDEENGWSDDDDELDIELAASSNNSKNVNNEHGNGKEHTIMQQNNYPSQIIDENETCQPQPQQEQQNQKLDSRQKHLIAMMKGMMETKIVINNYVDDDFVYDESTGIIPTRRRFVSRSDMLTSRS